MGLSHDLRKATARIRREQRRRNTEMEGKPSSSGVKMDTRLAAEDKMLRKMGENKAPEPAQAPTLESVPFVSDRARELAEDAGLWPLDFAGRAYSGATGFNAADVRGIAAEIQERDK